MGEKDICNTLINKEQKKKKILILRIQALSSQNR